MRTIWTEHERTLLRSYKRLGWSQQAMATRLGKSVSGIARELARLGLIDAPSARAPGPERMQQPPPADLPDTRDLTAQLLGDPPPGRIKW